MWSEFWKRRTSGRDGVARAVWATVCIAAGVAAALSPAGSLAREPGASDNYFPGSTVDAPVGALPPGITEINYFTYYSGEAVDAHGNKLGYSVSSQAYVSQFWWNPNIKILGANYGAFILQPFANAQVDNRSDPALVKLGTSSEFGAANTLFKPVNLSWNLAPNLYFSTAYGFYAPTGAYQTPVASPTKFTVNTGNNFWTFEPEIGLSYWKPGPNGYNLSAHVLYNVNSENEDTKYRSGDQLFVNLTATKSLGAFNAGIVGFYTKQTTADADYGHHYAPPFINVTSMPERLGAGPTIGGKIGPAVWDFSYMKDVWAISDTKGETLLLHVKFLDIFADGKQPLPPLK